MKRRFQVQITLMPGSEPWVRIELGDLVWNMPAGCSVLELLERCQGQARRRRVPDGDVYVRVPLDVALRAR